MQSSSKQEVLPEVDELRWGRLEDWIQLVRLPNIFTLLSNCVAASIIAVGDLSRLRVVIPLFCASILAYWAGLILNDVNDLDEDIKHRPTRPLAAGRISPALAGHVATAMLMLCPVMVILAGYGGEMKWLAPAVICSCLLWLSIRLYNSPLKHTLIGPVLMGTCRSLNIMMIGYGMLCGSVGVAMPVEQRLPHTLIAYALAVGVYICGITVFARREEQTSDQSSLALGTILELVGLVTAGCIPMWEAGRVVNWRLGNPAFPVLIGLIGLTILNRAVAGLMHPIPRKVQLAVKHAILSIIMIDASIVLMFAGEYYGVGTVLLLLPAVLGSIRIRTT